MLLEHQHAHISSLSIEEAEMFLKFVHHALVNNVVLGFRKP